MKRFYFLITIFMSVFAFSQNTINSDASLNWVGYMNVFDTSNNYMFGSGWGVADLKTEINTSANTITLKPNYNTYNASDSYWSDGAGNGNKIMEASTYYEPGATYNGQNLTFTGNVSSNTLSNQYTAVAFIKALDPANGYATVYNNFITIPASGTFTINAPASSLATGLLIQVGFTVRGINANPTTEAAKGSIVIAPANLSVASFSKKSLGIYPNLVTAGEEIYIKSKVKTVEVYNVSGQKVKSVSAQSINSQGLAKGVYIIKAETENGEVQSSKFIVK
ncbi:hypothetical protein GCM10010992_04680 [Cloacibacterium rupense]|uniref:Secretion system C-terminal sorting domain-containing protein n=1 Tax=Cloacibacterium rupense TaxID=517423 RepID=A0ABQ2NGX4_9FLAO|nr:T9SS type A sorting domain-containing protein [Cloacibacterium rupense]GGP02010.1 hypothetical protein GCM10010992_04680 [Cloacibacterium rupense]